MATKLLSDREKEIIFCILNGLNVIQTSEKLKLKQATVRGYIRRIAYKLRCRHSLMGIAVTSLVQGIVPLPAESGLLRPGSGQLKKRSDRLTPISRSDHKNLTCS